MGPKLFIGSSGESLPIVQLLEEGLKDDADITAWTDPTIFPPQKFYANSLLEVPGRFDFGLFLFEPDDVVQSRGQELAAPRDNVIFEFGLFMSRLGLERTFALAPRGRVKILSDIAGLQPLTYVEPREVAEFRKDLANTPPDKDPTRKALIAEIQNSLRAPLKSAMEDIRKLLKAGPIEAKGVYADAANVVEVGPVVIKLVRAALDIQGKAVVRHLALDMSEAWGILASNFLDNAGKSHNISWQCLMIDPKAPTIKKMASPSVSITTAASRIKDMKKFMSKNAKALAARKLSFECRLYADPPMVHGFHIENTALLWSACDIVKGKLDGDKTPYWRFDAADQKIHSAHPARCFKDWFDHRWKTAKAW